MNTKTIKIIGWVLTGLIALVFIASALFKLTGSGETAEKNAATFGLTLDTIKIVGVVELLCIALFIIPRTGILGTLLVAAYLGGAIATHLEHQMPVLAPCIIQAVVWITAILRFPELLTRIQGKSVVA